MPATKEKEAPEVVQETPVDTEKEALKQRLDLLEKMILNGTLPTAKEPEKVPAIQNDVRATLQRPKRIVFKIGAIQDEDAQIDGAWIPGKAVVSLFKFADELKCNQYGTRYTTGFEYDELEQTSGLKGEALVEFEKEVRIARQWIERYYPANLSADNVEFWRSRRLVVEDFDRIYDTKDSLENLILYYNIMGGGYTMVARSYDDAKTNRELKDQRLYLAVQAEEEERKFSGRKAYNKAIGMLGKIEDWVKADALYLMYYLPPVNNRYKGYTVNSPIEQIVNELGDFIDGVDTKIDKKKRPQMFLDAVDMFASNKDLVRTTGLFNAATYYGFVTYSKTDKSYTNRATGFHYGNSKKLAVEALMNPNNIDELSYLKSKVNDKWIS